MIGTPPGDMTWLGNFAEVFPECVTNHVEDQDEPGVRRVSLRDDPEIYRSTGGAAISPGL